jgi:hypothetical protein
VTVIREVISQQTGASLRIIERSSGADVRRNGGSCLGVCACGFHGGRHGSGGDDVVRSGGVAGSRGSCGHRARGCGTRIDGQELRCVPEGLTGASGGQLATAAVKDGGGGRGGKGSSSDRSGVPASLR